MSVKKPKVFVSYAREDGAAARRLHADLTSAGLAPWLDTLDLLPGQSWESSVRRAIGGSDFFLALLSSRSITKRGFVQKEIQHALDVAGEFPENQVFVIPVRLDSCLPTSERLLRLHMADLFPDYEFGLRDLLRVLQYQDEPSQDSTELLAQRVLGQVVRISDRGFGFVTSCFGSRDLFFHAQAREGSLTFDDLVMGQPVRFDVRLGPKGFSADRVSVAGLGFEQLVAASRSDA